MTEHVVDENGSPRYPTVEGTAVTFDAQYAVTADATTTVTFDAAGPKHRMGSGWIMGVFPVRTRKGDIEPVYLVQVYSIDGERVPDDVIRTILLGEPEITSATTYDAVPVPEE